MALSSLILFAKRSSRDLKQEDTNLMTCSSNRETRVVESAKPRRSFLCLRRSTQDLSHSTSASEVERLPNFTACPSITFQRRLPYAIRDVALSETIQEEEDPKTSRSTSPKNSKHNNSSSQTTPTSLNSRKVDVDRSKTYRTVVSLPKMSPTFSVTESCHAAVSFALNPPEPLSHLVVSPASESPHSSRTKHIASQAHAAVNKRGQSLPKSEISLELLNIEDEQQKPYEVLENKLKTLEASMRIIDVRQLEVLQDYHRIMGFSTQDLIEGMILKTNDGLSHTAPTNQSEISQPHIETPLVVKQQAAVQIAMLSKQIKELHEKIAISEDNLNLLRITRAVDEAHHHDEDLPRIVMFSSSVVVPSTSTNLNTNTGEHPRKVATGSRRQIFDTSLDSSDISACMIQGYCELYDRTHKPTKSHLASQHQQIPSNASSGTFTPPMTPVSLPRNGSSRSSKHRSLESFVGVSRPSWEPDREHFVAIHGDFWSRSVQKTNSQETLQRCISPAVPVKSANRLGRMVKPKLPRLTLIIPS